MKAGEAGLPDEITAFLELLFRLAGEAGDYIGGYRGFRRRFPDCGYRAAVVGCRVAAVHPFQNAVAAALEREVKVRAEPFVLPEIDENGSYLLRLQ